MRTGREPNGLANDPEGPDIQRLQAMKWDSRQTLQGLGATAV
jgi:hypothetical protein